MAITECKEVENKVVKTMKIFDAASAGPEVLIEFTDGTIFSASLKPAVTVEAKCYRDEGGTPTILADLTPRHLDS